MLCWCYNGKMLHLQCRERKKKVFYVKNGSPNHVQYLLEIHLYSQIHHLKMDYKNTHLNTCIINHNMTFP